ncbi:hypothetical protein LUZ60_005980 [Juncus effusus]|nr:hypothetical protein LUZ60_005980 [Juncus effusus]
MERRRSHSPELTAFITSGVYNLSGAAVFVDPVRLLNESYSHFRLSPSSYYSRSFPPQNEEEKPQEQEESKDLMSDKKRKRKAKVNKKKKEHVCLNERELRAERRHQEVRPLLVEAHRKLMEADELVRILPEVVKSDESMLICEERRSECNFVELGSNWRADFSEISLSCGEDEDQDLRSGQAKGRRLVPLFNNVINVDTDDDCEAEFQNRKYILPQRCNFLMSDLKQVHKLIPEKSNEGFNLIVIDPPWENASARQKSKYPTLPNKHFLYLPIKKLAHSNGALVALWVTNREKFQDFVFDELFPFWGVTNVVHFYWLKVKKDRSLIGDLDLFHHRPYECLLLGYVNVDSNSDHVKSFKQLKESQVIISIPGTYSRKPPLAKILEQYIPGKNPIKCVELFARELIAGWTSWGNEPLHFHDSLYFLRKK